MTENSEQVSAPEVSFVDLKTQLARLRPDIDARLAAVMSHGQFIMGPEVIEFENELANFAGAEIAVGVASGTDALRIALMAEGIGAGDAVFLPSFTFTATAEVIFACGAEPVFCDVDDRNFNLDVRSLRSKIDETKKNGSLRPRAIIAVDLFGLPADYEGIDELAAAHDIVVIADAAQSFGAQTNGKRVGGLAPVTATSFFPTKPLACFGDGGALLTNDSERADIYRSIRAHGKGTAKYDITRIGLNSRLDTMQAAVLLSKLTVFEDELEARQKLADEYTNALSDIVVTPLVDNRSQRAWAQYAILVDDRDAVASALKEKGVPTMVYYPKPMHMQPAYMSDGKPGERLPVSENLAGTNPLPANASLYDAGSRGLCLWRC